MSAASTRQMPTQVLVVGAGPVGLFAALRLSQRGARVRLIEQQPERRAHTFPVVLHPQTLRLLTMAGVSAALFWRGRPITRLAVYSELERRAVLDFHEVPGATAGLMSLPQDILRQALAHALRERGVEVEWNTRLAVLQQDARSVWGRLVREDPALILRGERAESSAFEADFVIGADGYESTVREALGLQLVDDGVVQSFAFFDATTHRAGNEATLALAEARESSAYPLQGGQTRFTFQLNRALNKAPDEAALHELLRARLPWYREDLVSFDWGGIAEFRRALVTRFGVGRVWLAGEAAHLTGPLGVQSLNIGIDEAEELSTRIAAALEDPSSPDFGPHYDAKRHRQWRHLLGHEEQPHVTSRCPEWVRRNVRTLMSALPASEHDLDDLLAQLRLLPSAPPAQQAPHV